MFSRFGDQPFAGAMGIGGTFKQTYRCYSVSMLPGHERHDVERGGKIIMPPSALDTLTRLNIQYPMLFKLSNGKAGRETHCGVLEFVADEGRIYVPYWMMVNNLLLEEGGLVTLESVSLPVATFAKFQPQSVDFLDITNPKAVLENALRCFACLTTGDIVAIKYNEKIYELCVLESKPGKAVSIIECDMNVDFAAPVGYQEEMIKKQEQAAAAEQQPEEMAEIDTSDLPESFQAFSGTGSRLDGKAKGTEATPTRMSIGEMQRGIPNYNYKVGKLTFIRIPRNVQNGDNEKNDLFEAFGGQGQSLRKKTSGK